MCSSKDQIDNVGKSTQIENIKQLFNNQIFQTLHYSSIKGLSKEDNIRYSEHLYDDMFSLFEDSNYNRNIICDRSHLGEYVYGKMYRDYDPDWIFSLEQDYSYSTRMWNRLSLITFIDEPQNLIDRDDGLSFSTDLDKKTEEIERFVKAHNRSMIKHKALININGKDADAVFKEIEAFFESF